MKPIPFLYLIGPPGAGKSTALAMAFSGTPYSEVSVPFAHALYWTGSTLRPIASGTRYITGAQLGATGGPFPGTDRLSMAVQPKALAFLATNPFPALVAEGDRLANDAFFTAVREMGYDLTVALVDTPPAVCAYRRQLRGSTQNPAWIKSRETKVARLAQKWADAEWRLAPSQVDSRLANHPAVVAIREGR